MSLCVDVVLYEPTCVYVCLYVSIRVCLIRCLTVFVCVLSVHACVCKYTCVWFMYVGGSMWLCLCM